MRATLLIAFLATSALATEGVPEATIITSDSAVATAQLKLGWKYIRCLGTNYFRLEGTEAAAGLEDNSGIKLPAGVLWPVKVGPNTRWIGIRSANGASGCYVYPTDNPSPVPLSNISGTDITPTSISTGAITAGAITADSLNTSGDVMVSGALTSSATTGTQFACTGAATCNVQSASGRTLALDTKDSATASLGANNATTTTVGRTSQTTNLNGIITAGGSTTAGTITLSGGTGTAAVRSGARCVCSETTSAATPGKCAVSSTTLTATYGVGTDVITYICL